MNIASTITPYLMLGSAGVRTAAFLKNNKITLVINAAKNFAMTEDCCVPQIKISADDSPEYSLKHHFNEIASNIYNEKENGGKIFVHCIAGISRAPSLVIAYLMKYENMTLEDAHELVRSNRTFVRPNLGFWQQLVDYENDLRGKNSVQMVSIGSACIPSVYTNQYKNMVSF